MSVSATKSIPRAVRAARESRRRERLRRRIAGESWIDCLPTNLAKSGLRQARRAVVLVLGSTVVLIGIALLVLPGPAFVVIPAGIAILGVEFAWARRLLLRVRLEIQALGWKASKRAKGPTTPIPTGGNR